MIGLKLKKGDQVVCKVTYKNQFTAGKVYTVRQDVEIFHNYDGIGIEEDDRGSKHNGWFAAYFIKFNDCKLSRLVYNVRI